MPPRLARLVSIGGGTGLSTLLEGLRPLVSRADPLVDLTAIVTVTDDGRSSGRLRREFAVPPPGDLRNCLVALAPDQDGLAALFRHRFPGAGPLGGHSLGNLLLLGLMQIEGDLLAAIETARQMLGIRARVLPSTTVPVDLVAAIGGEEIRGQVAIKSREGSIERLKLHPPDAPGLPAAIAAIKAADLITLGPGSLFTSVIANLIVPGIAAALANSRAQKIFICNAMTEYDETDGLSAVDHVRTLLAYAPDLRLDDALFNSTPISAEMRERYAAERAVALDPPAIIPPDLAGIRFTSLPLASESRFVRHDPQRLGRVILELAGVSHSRIDGV
ncbi:MAG: uridine diphosphate-N-acetylglucosamine-binding protein YvcK [Acidobacteriota bacterium]